MIYVMSGGAGKLFAAIGVTYPEGSTLTCTDGTKTLKAKTTTGQWVFSIPYAGTWTVTATDGTETVSKAVEITTEGQSEKVYLAYKTEGYLYNAGTFNADYERTEKKNSYGKLYYRDANLQFGSTAEKTSYSFLIFHDVVLNGQSKIVVNYYGEGTYSNGTTLAVLEDPDSWDPTKTATGTLAYMYADSASVSTDALLDISGIAPGKYAVAVGHSTQGSSWTAARTVYVNSLRLE